MLFVHMFLLLGLTAHALGAAAISGRIMDLSDGPIPGASVTLKSSSSAGAQLTMHTDKSGRYAFDVVPNGTYSIEASFDGFVGMCYHRVRSLSPNKQTFNFVLPFDVFPFEIHKYVREPDPSKRRTLLSGELAKEGVPLSEVEVCLSAGERGFCAEANRLGQFSVKVPPGIYNAVVSMGDETIHEQTVNLEHQDEYYDLISLGR